ncbi:hypothetical protein GCM10010185_63570 [Saccharothrix coeruleofusca]|uniref:Uncharacterized protein n=1 Tax=Saccharothrix coeruleofusca TaxID=33919 RepID=A0A918AWK8_9PSEU|nr:hypothetical protein GCM10010185_63570 [Saccharothrix coeruleofusca]
MVLALGFALAGCGSEWEGEVRFEVTRIAPPYESMGERKPEHVVLALDQEVPDSVRGLQTTGADIDQFPEGVAVGDRVLCRVRQSDDNGLDGVDPTTTVGPCREA